MHDDLDDLLKEVAGADQPGYQGGAQDDMAGLTAAQKKRRKKKNKKKEQKMLMEAAAAADGAPTNNLATPAKATNQA